jgi:uncharacterized protein YfaQ (DUF2300 family)
MNSRRCQRRNLRFLYILKTLTISFSLWGIQRMRMFNPSATRTTRAILFVALVSIFVSPSLSSMAQQPADQQSTVRAPEGGLIGGAAGAAIATEGELKSTIRTFQGDNPSAVYRYYWWHDSCYVRFKSDNYKLVTSDYCRH